MLYLLSLTLKEGGKVFSSIPGSTSIRLAVVEAGLRKDLRLGQPSISRTNSATLARLSGLTKNSRDTFIIRRAMPVAT